MKKFSLFFISLLFLVFSCDKEMEEDVDKDNYYEAYVHIVSTSLNNCDLKLGIDTNFNGGTDISYHAINLPDTAERGDEYFIKYNLTGDVFDCEIYGPSVGSPLKSYEVIEITAFK